MIIGLLGNKSSYSNRLILVNPKSENDVRLQAKLGNKNSMGLPVGVVREVVELCVDEKARNQGIGHLMIEYAKHLAKVKDAEILELTTNQKRKAAHRFYEREGFKNTHFKYTLDL